MTDLERRYLDYIQKQLCILSERVHTDSKLQLIHQLGFLQAQMAQAMSRDPAVLDRFKLAVEKNGLTKPAVSRTLRNPYS